MKLDWHRYPGHMQIMTNVLGRPIPQFDFYTDLPAGENHTFESDVINLMETIGFKFNKSYDNNGETKMAGVAYNDSLYQLISWSKDNRNYIMEKINKIFSLELRDQKLNKLIYEN